MTEAFGNMDRMSYKILINGFRLTILMLLSALACYVIAGRNGDYTYAMGFSSGMYEAAHQTAMITLLASIACDIIVKKRK